MDFQSKWHLGLGYADFLQKFGSPDQRQRWETTLHSIELTAAQKALLAGFQRDQLVVVTAAPGAATAQQCPIFEAFARETPRLQIRYFDRDVHPDLAHELSICGGKRVPSVLFLSEDFQPCGRYGDRTLAKYRDLASAMTGASCPTGIVPVAQTLQQAVVQEWLDQFERIQLMLRLSSRLRQKHGD